MEDFIACLIGGAFAISLGILGIKIYNEFETKKRRKERLYFAEKRLHKMALQFRDECMEETKKVIVKYTSSVRFGSYRICDWAVDFIFDYRKSIGAMKEDYLTAYAKKYSDGDNGLRIEAEDLPRYILDEYEAEISEIANTFYEISYHMADQINELKGR